MGKKLSPEEYKKIRLTILKKLYSNGAWGKKHLLFERLQSGMPPHLYGFVEDVLTDLVKEELVVHYGKTKYGDAYHLNIAKKAEIEKELGVFR
jgi:hypothetical protein